MSNSKKIKQLVLAAFFVAIELVLMLTPLGYIPIGPIRATTMHIPVLVAGILLGKKYGASLGFVFGLTSLLKNTFTPTPTSFVFTPFITVGGMQGNFFSLVIVFVPRILLGYFAGSMYGFLKQKMNDTVAVMTSAILNTLIHTCLVLGGIYIFFGEAYGEVLNKSMEAVKAFMIGIITTNGIMEVVLAALVVPVLVKALKPTVERMKIHG